MRGVRGIIKLATAEDMATYEAERRKKWVSVRCPVSENMYIDLDAAELSEAMDNKLHWISVCGGNTEYINGYQDAIKWYDDFCGTKRGRLLAQAVMWWRQEEIRIDTEAAAFAFGYRDMVNPIE